MKSTALSALALALLLVAPAAGQERYSRHSGKSLSLGIGSHGVRAAVRLTSTPRCAPAPRRVWVAGAWDRVWVDPVYAQHYDRCGNPYRVIVEPGHYRRVWRAGYWRSSGYSRGSVRARY